MLLFSVDTNVLIFGVQKGGTEDRKHMIPLANVFFGHARDEKIQIMIPSQVVAEYLVRGTKEERDNARAAIESSFFIAPFDAEAAYIAAEIASNRNLVEDVKNTFGKTRQVIKADINIIATSVRFKAERLVTSNAKEIRALAQGYKLIVEDLEEFALRIQSEKQKQGGKSAIENPGAMGSPEKKNLLFDMESE